MGANPYSDGPAAALSGPVHPGGAALTRRALEAAALPPGAALLDIGCGPGASMELALEKGYDARGVDPSLPYLEQAAERGLGGRVQRGEAQALPFPNETFDGVLLECSLSVMEDRAAVLEEIRRVLKKGGRLMLSDLFAPTTDAQRLDVLDAESFALTQPGFTCLLDENHTRELHSFFAQMIFTLGDARGARQALLGSEEEPEGFRRLQYRLLILEKQ